MITSELSAHQSIQLNSLAFVLFAALACSTILAVRRWKVDKITMLFFNIIFLYYLIEGSASLIYLCTLLLFTYYTARLRREYASKVPSMIFLSIILLMWATLFFVKDPLFAGNLNPFNHFPIHLVGISFLMFRAINFVEDAEVLEKINFVDFVNYMLYFPTIIAGPIVRFDEFHMDYESPKTCDRGQLLSNMHRVANGFIKKFIIADNLYIFTTFGQENFSDLSTPLLWVYVALQLPVLYIDFSGYCDIVIGMSRMIGINIPENFDKPYKARNIQEFWSRWHITLSSFIRDYVFNPLNKLIFTKFPEKWQGASMYGNYFFTMMLIALWHGTTWGFFIFGLMHGCVIILFQASKNKSSYLHSISNTWIFKGVSGWTINFVYLSISMIFWSFSVEETSSILSQLVGIK
jgi:alginate O-acetyltransferase complex protein AlgI